MPAVYAVGVGKAYVVEGIGDKRERSRVEADCDGCQHKRKPRSDAAEHALAISATKKVKEMPMMSISLRAFVSPAMLVGEFLDCWWCGLTIGRIYDALGGGCVLLRVKRIVDEENEGRGASNAKRAFRLTRSSAPVGRA